MKAQSWKDYAELVALFALVGTLIAVVIELRQTQAALQAQTYQDRAFDAIDFQFRAAANPIMIALGHPGALRDPDALSVQEYQTMRRFFLALRVDLDNEHYQWQQGFLDDNFYNGSTVREIKALAPMWRRFGLNEPRQEFHDAVKEILENDSIEPMLRFE